MTNVSGTRRAAAIQTRGECVEAWHEASAAVVDGSFRLVASLGDPELVTATRSTLKPFQALALVESGTARALGVTQEELAIASASHSGMPEHVQIVTRLLERIGASARALQCGAHLPIGYRIAHRKAEAGEDENPLHHNCSGKHAGFLALSHALGEPLEDYLSQDSRTQREVLETLARVFGVPASSLPRGTDGCSAPNYALPLTTLARGALSLRLGRLPGPLAAQADDEPGESTPAVREQARLEGALGEIRDAMLAHPRLVSGESRFDYELMRTFPSNALSKSGAEAIQILAFSDPPLGIAIKVHDGSDRALAPICLGILEALGVLGPEPPPPLARRRSPGVKNYRGLVVGRIEAHVELARYDHESPGGSRP